MAVTGKDFLVKRETGGEPPDPMTRDATTWMGRRGDGQLVNPETGFGQKENYKNTIITLCLKFFKNIKMQNKYNL